MTSDDIGTMLTQTIDRGGAAPAIAYRGEWREWWWIADYCAAATPFVRDAARIGIVASNQPAHVSPPC